MSQFVKLFLCLKKQDMVKGNESASIFRNIMGNLKHRKDVSYPVDEDVDEEFYCQKTGLLANEFCKEKDIGYYKESFLPEKCTCH